MFHYKYSRDLRINNLEQIIFAVAQWKILSKKNHVFSANTDKSINNVSSTISFYMGLYDDSKNITLALENNTRPLLLNFIKKFQFPNPRTSGSYDESKTDGIILAPLRVVLQLLHIDFLYDNKGITFEEIKNFIFFNTDIAKNKYYDVISLYHNISQYRYDSTIPSSVEKDPSKCLWADQDREIREMLMILEIAGVASIDKESYFISSQLQHEYGNGMKFSILANMQKQYELWDILTYNQFWEPDESILETSYENYMRIGSMAISKPFNRVVFGAPGTGKSYLLEKERQEYFTDEQMERATFHSNYTYANFVGTYKPTKEGNNITYKYVPGPFIRVLVKALKNPNENYLLLIEEINRANPAATFGDIFQLLDRENGVSKYSIEASEDLKQYLESEGISESKLKLPENMYIWSTMNSVDQGVFPMDTAFKRRWSFEYLGVNENEEIIADYKFTIKTVEVSWNKLRKAINNKLLQECQVYEDKLLGPFFLSIEDLGTDLYKAFLDKVLMYLYEDAAKHARKKLFSNDGRENIYTYSNLCKEFKDQGVAIFGFSADGLKTDNQNTDIESSSSEELENN